MAFIKLTYGWPKRYKFVPVDEESHSIFGMLTISADFTDDGKYAIQVNDSYPSDPSNKASELVDDTQCIQVDLGQKVTFDYHTIEWDYMRGHYHSYDTIEAVVVEDDVALHETDDDVVKALVYYYKEDYQKAWQLLTPLLAPDQFYRVNRPAHQLVGLMYEFGCGVEKDLKKAYIHYLYARDYERFDEMSYHGFGRGVLESPRKLWNDNDWDEYHALLLLNDIGESEYAYNAMIERANDWFYSDKEKTSKRADYLHNHKYVALARKTACLWAMKRCDYTFGASEEFLLFAGAYCSYLSQGHEGSCSYVKDNGGGSVAHLKSTSFAEWWLDKAIEGGDAFAIKAKQFIQKSKEQQQ